MNTSINTSVKNLVVLGLDPGYVNFGWSVSKMAINTDIDDNSIKVKLLEYGKITNTITDFTKDVRQQVIAYVDELSQIVNKHSVTLIVAERYQSRGFKGISVEYINAMLGMLLHIAFKNNNLDSQLVLPSTWKNSAKKQKIDLVKLYKEHKAIMSPHEVDATFISWYGAMCTHSSLLPLSGLSNSVNDLIMACPTTIQKRGHVLMVK